MGADSEAVVDKLATLEAQFNAAIEEQAAAERPVGARVAQEPARRPPPPPSVA